MDCGFTLVYGSVEDVMRETKEIIRKASPGGGHVLTSSNVIHNWVPLENYMAMLETARTYGRYPIAL